VSVLPDRDVVPMHPASGDQPAGPIALRDYGRSKVLRFFDLPWVSARWFFRSHAGLLSREVILRIARLTDNEETGAQRNLVLASILSDAGIDAVPDLREELSHELEELHELSKAVRHHRHKYLAHLDHAAATGAAPPALPVTWEDIARLIPGGHPKSPTCGHPKLPHLIPSRYPLR